MKKITLIVICLGFGFLTACSFYIHDNNYQLRKGMTVQDFEKKNIDYDKVLNLTDQTLISDGKYRVYTYEVTDAGSDQYYYYLFKDDKLIYWGYPYTFNRHPNPMIRLASKEAGMFITS